MNYQWRDFIGSLVDGKYPLIEYLGDVAGDGVYATNPVDSRQAIIRLTPGGTDDAHRILERWQSATTLSHPNLAKTHAAGETEVIGNTVVFTVTERPDDSLGEAVRNRALTEGEAQVLTESVLRALVYLHEHGFAHRAVSPDNIVAVGDDIKLAPWTIARATGKDQGRRYVRGRPDNRRSADAEAADRRCDTPAIAAAALCRRGAGRVFARRWRRRKRSASFAPCQNLSFARKFKLPTAALVALSLAVVALLYGVRSYTSSSPSQAAPPGAGFTREGCRSRPEAFPKPLQRAHRRRGARAGSGWWLLRSTSSTIRQ
jgi:serine/threonine protein kinase